MATLFFKRLNALPSQLAPQTAYITKSATPGYLQLTVTGDTVASVFRTMVPADIAALINTDASIVAIRQSVTDLAAVVAEGLAARTLTRDLGTMAFVSMTWLRGEATQALVNVAANSSVALTVAMPGLELQDIPMVPQTSIVLPDAIAVSARVGAANQMRILYRNMTSAAVDVPAHTLFSTALKQFSV